MTLLDQHLLELLEDFHPMKDNPSRSVRRPAGELVLIEASSPPAAQSEFRGLTHFWMEAIHRFLDQSGSDVRWFEGLAYQSVFTKLTPTAFHQEYRALQQKHLTLPPPETVELTLAYRVLQGRVISYLGITLDEEYWAGTLGPSHCLS